MTFPYLLSCRKTVRMAFPRLNRSQALLYLESISPQPLLVQLLSALLGLSIFVMEEACSSAKCLPVVKVKRLNLSVPTREALSTPAFPEKIVKVRRR